MMDKELKDMSYEEVVAQIEQILNRFKSQQISVDELTKEVVHASELIKHCRERLTKAERELTAIIGEE